MIYNLGGVGGAPDADQIPYENYTSGLDAENVQEAIDEVQDNVETVQNNVDTVNGRVTSVNNKVDTVKVFVGSDGKLYFRNGLGADTALNFSSGLKTLTRVNAVWSYVGVVYTSYSAYIPASLFDANAQYLFMGGFNTDGNNMPIPIGFKYEVMDKVVNGDGSGNFVYRMYDINPNFIDKQGNNRLWLDGIQVLRYTNMRILKIN